MKFGLIKRLLTKQKQRNKIIIIIIIIIINSKTLGLYITYSSQVLFVAGGQTIKHFLC